MEDGELPRVVDFPLRLVKFRALHHQAIVEAVVMRADVPHLRQLANASGRSKASGP